MRERVVITGTGAVSGAGRDPASMLDAILEGRSAIRAIEAWDTTGWPVTHAAEIPAFNARALVDDRKLHKFIRRTDPRGRVYFWNAPGTPEMKPDPDSDEFALSEGYITVTPLQFDLTNHELTRRLKLRS